MLEDTSSSSSSSCCRGGSHTDRFDRLGVSRSFSKRSDKVMGGNCTRALTTDQRRTCSSPSSWIRETTGKGAEAPATRGPTGNLVAQTQARIQTTLGFSNPFARWATGASLRSLEVQRLETPHSTQRDEFCVCLFNGHQRCDWGLTNGLWAASLTGE